ncbi:MAG: hypothetical protein IPP71_13620 [Bacteroidetes bacterium]|nr:hypothetical protein [Bacteroidota bacterium]
MFNGNKAWQWPRLVDYFSKSDFSTGGSNNDWYTSSLLILFKLCPQSMGAQNRTNSGRTCFQKLEINWFSPNPNVVGF